MSSRPSTPSSEKASKLADLFGISPEQAELMANQGADPEAADREFAEAAKVDEHMETLRTMTVEP